MKLYFLTFICLILNLQGCKERIRTHNSSHIDNVNVAFIYETKNVDTVEKCLKAILESKQYRKRKEFYQIDLDVLKELIKTCDELTLKVKNHKKKIKQNDIFYIMLDKHDKK